MDTEGCVVKDITGRYVSPLALVHCNTTHETQALFTGLLLNALHVPGPAKLALDDPPDSSSPSGALVLQDKPSFE